MGFLSGKRGIIFGVANKSSIAWGVARAMADQGAELALTYQNESFKKRVQPLAEELGADLVLPCDVTDESQVEGVFKELESQWGGLDILVHALAYAPKEELRGGYVESTTKEGFMTAHDVSSWSLTRLAQGAYPLMKNREDASILTMSYLGAERYIPHYNVMGVAKASLEASVRYLAASMGPEGIRVNAVSAGPIKTLASSGIGDMRLILQHNEDRAPLRRNTTIEEVGNTSAFLASPLASGITGEVLHVDSGYHSVAM
ncbi:enoyl-ACP reductase [Thiohalorhabdus denitrificans]|uniref:Enoyl-[acyl-carrier-protein] reductase [NADH] n=1 Tax=Thiohalorhabdus denitrificans TaxID=381306 RepID=A0A0P9C2J1_9GAMM|nr:enoyl-ACP reductase [Thiohalorhabdus denitrificans]KPV39156.1 enoyl-ACP reductase [Thiohalorhabdus denitrificans]SCX76183.1 Enoyl-[acyl-carrier-protein] reductase [NADH] [Thiohalorhabdus denitrificans]